MQTRAPDLVSPRFMEEIGRCRKQDGSICNGPALPHKMPIGAIMPHFKNSNDQTVLGHEKEGFELKIKKGSVLKFRLRTVFTRSLHISLLVTILATLYVLPPSSQDAAYAQSGTTPELEAPTLTATSTGATSVEVSWTTVSGAAGYELWVWWSSDTSWQQLGGGILAGTSHTHSELTPGRTYYYTVVAVDSGGQRGAWSEHVPVTVPGASQPLDAPVLTATSAGANAIDVSWNPVSGAVSYELWAWWDSDTDWQRLGDSILTGTSFNHAELSAGLTYYYLIAAVDASDVRGEWSTQVFVTLPATSLGLDAPALTAASTVTSTVELSWSPITGAASYELWTWLDSGTGWQRLDDGSLTGTLHTHMGATAGLTYYYIAAAVDANGVRGAWSQIISVIVSETPAILDDPDERATLVALYQATGGANWARNDHWLTAASISTWYGVRTDNDGRVVELLLSSNGLNGSIPNLTSLNRLSSLSLGSNQLTGTFPDLKSLKNLEVLDLSYNQLTGSVSGLNALTQLVWITTNNNQLTGQLPELGALTNLLVLDLSSNQFTGTVPDLSTLNKLEELSLSNNELNGTISGLGTLANLTLLYLGSNQFSGPLPDLSALVNLKVLSLSGNNLSGPIEDLSALTNLSDLYLGSNQFTGSFPQISTLDNLRWLDLSHNQLTGPIPQLNSLTNLRLLRLDHNLFSGSIPRLNALTNLTELALGSNQLTGSVPDVGPLTKLTWLDLSDNQLTGRLPDTGALVNLSSMNLSRNQLSGSIPALNALTKLSELDLGSNQLTGAIPDLSSLVELTTLILASNQLTGPIPDLSTLTKLANLDLSANQLCKPDSLNPSDSNAVVSSHLASLNLPSCTAA